MVQTTIRTRNGRQVTVSSKDLAALDECLNGELLTRSHLDYEDARALWNGTIDRRPALIAQCHNTGDVVDTVNFCRERDLSVTVRGGGHNVAGSASLDDGVVIDLGHMNHVGVDPVAHIAHVQGGATLGDLDAATQQHGLVVPSGFVSATGVAGLTLRGGLGHTMRRFGMTCDNLVGVELVTADGEIIQAAGESHPEIMWALRGGPLDLGVVTKFRFQLHELEPHVRLVMAAYPRERGMDLNRLMRDQLADAPRELGMISFYARLPDDAELPEAVRGRDLLVLFGMFTGDEADADNVLAPFLEHPDLVADLGGWMDYTDAQRVLDEDYPDGMRYYWKSVYLDELSDKVIELLHELSANMSADSTLDVWNLGGAIADAPKERSCFPMRDAKYMVAIEANWEDPADDASNRKWARRAFDALQPYSSGVYMNFAGDQREFADTSEAVYGKAWDRLQRIKQRLDPDGFF